MGKFICGVKACKRTDEHYLHSASEWKEFMNPTQSEWWNNEDNVFSLARHLIDNGYLESADDVYYFFEKPWKYNKQWETYNEE